MNVQYDTRTPLYVLPADLSISITDEEQKANLLLRAETLVDSLVGFHQKRSQNQKTVFPRLQDTNTAGQPVIPWEVSQATKLMAHIIHSQGDYTGINAGDSFSLGDLKISKGNVSNSLRENLKKTPQGQEILALLSDFVSFTFKIS